MAYSFAAVADLLFCPDDGASLGYSSSEFSCCRCARRFPIHEENLAEILPCRPCELPEAVNPSYREAYLSAFHQSFCSDDAAFAWGAEETVSESWARKRRRQVAMVRRLVTAGTNPGGCVLCDISAGAGYYSLAYADMFRFVLHCDLSVNNLSYARRKARSLGIHGVFFLRADYFAPPFRQSLDRILSMDTLIRGEAHDCALLTAIARSLKPSGYAVIDLHNWWHNPLRRLGLLPENFSENQSYDKRKAEHLLHDAGISAYECFPFYQEFEDGGARWPSLSRVLPATRFLFRFIGSNYQSSTYVSQGGDGS